MLRADTCRHFTGLMRETCDAGVNYRELAGEPQFGMALRLPCTSHAHFEKFDPAKVVPCARCSFPSQEEADAAMAAARKASEEKVARFAGVSDGNEHHLYRCARCAGEPLFDGGTAFTEHLEAVHGMARPIQVGRTMALHMDATTWHQTDSELYLPDGETLIGWDSHRHPRQGSDRALWSEPKKRGKKR